MSTEVFRSKKKSKLFIFLVRNSFHPKVERKKEKERKRRVRGRKGAIIRRWKKLFFLISYSKVKTEKAEKAKDKRMFGPFFKKKMTTFFLLIFFLSLLRKKNWWWIRTHQFSFRLEKFVIELFFALVLKKTVFCIKVSQEGSLCKVKLAGIKLS